MTDQPTRVTRQDRRHQQRQIANLTPTQQAALGAVMRDRIALGAASLLLHRVLHAVPVPDELDEQIRRFLGEHPPPKDWS